MAASLNISLAEPLKAYLDAKINAGEYTDASEYVSELIRHDRESLQATVEGEVSALQSRLIKAVENEECAIELTAEEVRHGGVISLLRERLRAA